MSQARTTTIDVSLSPMVASRFQSWFDICTEEYAKDKQKTFGCTLDAARAFAKSSMSHYLSEGVDTPDHHFFEVINEQGAKVGSIWFAVKTDFEQRSAFLYDIQIDDQHQGKGYGRAAMQALEREVSRLGIDTIALHVFAFNERALALYRSLGFEITDYSMAKKI